MQEELDGAVRNKAVFQGISKRLQEQGYSRDWEQCRTKIKSLKKEYRMVKDHNGEWGEGENMQVLCRAGWDSGASASISPQHSAQTTKH